MSINVLSLRGCECVPKSRKRWYVRHYRCNHSAFQGYRETPSDYSSVACAGCGRSWRTKANYVEGLPLGEANSC